MAKYFILWNDQKTEGVIIKDDEEESKTAPWPSAEANMKAAIKHKSLNWGSSLCQAMVEFHEDGKLTYETIELP